MPKKKTREYDELLDGERTPLTEHVDELREIEMKCMRPTKGFSERIQNRFDTERALLCETIMDARSPFDLYYRLHEEYGLDVAPNPNRIGYPSQMMLSPLLAVVRSRHDDTLYYKPIDPVTGHERSDDLCYRLLYDQNEGDIVTVEQACETADLYPDDEWELMRRNLIWIATHDGYHLDAAWELYDLVYRNNPIIEYMEDGYTGEKPTASEYENWLHETKHHMHYFG